MLFFFGFVSVLTIITWYLSWIFKDRVFRWVSLFLFTALCNFACATGFASQYVWPEWPEIGQKLPGVILYSNIFCALGLCRAFLFETVSKTYVDKLLYGFMAASLVMMLFCFGEGWILYAVVWAMYRAAPLVYILICLVAFFSFRKKQQAAFFLLIGLSVCILAFYFGEALSEKDAHIFNSRSYLFPIALGYLFVCFAAMDRLRILKEYEKDYQIYQERERIGRDLHDNIGTQLSLMSSGLGRLLREPQLHINHVEHLQRSMKTALTDLRDTIWVINKNEVTLEEIEDKINNLFWRLRQNNELVKYQLQVIGISAHQKLMPGKAINLFRIIQEAINNCDKHSNASAVKVVIERVADQLYIRIDDNGKGFEVDSKEQAERYGLKNMKRRANEINAKFFLTSKPDIAPKSICNWIFYKYFQ